MNTDYDDVLRRALHAAAESIEPSADGLERIQARLGPVPMLSLATATAWCSGVTVRFTTWAEPALAAAVDIFWTVVDRFRPVTDAEHGRPRYGWLRPLAAMGTAIFVVAAGAFAVMTLPQAISSSGSISLPWSQHDGSSHGGGGSGLNGSGSQLITGPGSTGVPGRQPGVSAATSTCSPSGSSSPVTTPPVTTPPVTTPPVTTPPVTTPPTTTSPPDTTSPTSPADTTSPDPGSVNTPTPSAASAGPTDSAADSAFIVPSRSLAPSPCPSPSTSSTAQPSTSTGPAALQYTPYGIGANRAGASPAGTTSDRG